MLRLPKSDRVRGIYFDYRKFTTQKNGNTANNTRLPPSMHSVPKGLRTSAVLRNNACQRLFASSVRNCAKPHAVVGKPRRRRRENIVPKMEYNPTMQWTKTENDSVKQIIFFKFLNKMSRFFKYSFLVAIVAFATVGCKKEDPDDRKISPPAWIHGEWEWSLEGGNSSINYKFTSNDIFSTVTVPDYSPVTLIFSELNKTSHILVKETEKTDEIYEVTFMDLKSGKWEINHVRRFKKGDGTYIDFIDDSPVSTRLIKK